MLTCTHSPSPYPLVITLTPTFTYIDLSRVASQSLLRDCSRNTSSPEPIRPAKPVNSWSLLNQYSNHLDSQLQDGRSKLLAAYGMLAAKEESLILAEQVHTQSYRDNSDHRKPMVGGRDRQGRTSGPLP